MLPTVNLHFATNCSAANHSINTTNNSVGWIILGIGESPFFWNMDSKQIIFVSTSVYFSVNVNYTVARRWTFYKIAEYNVMHREVLSDPRVRFKEMNKQSAHYSGGICKKSCWRWEICHGGGFFYKTTGAVSLLHEYSQIINIYMALHNILQWFAALVWKYVKRLYCWVAATPHNVVSHWDHNIILHIDTCIDIYYGSKHWKQSIVRYWIYYPTLEIR